MVTKKKKTTRKKRASGGTAGKATKKAANKKATKKTPARKPTKKKVAKKAPGKPAKRKVSRETTAKKTPSRQPSKKKVAKKTVKKVPALSARDLRSLSVGFESSFREQLDALREQMENMFDHYFPDMPRPGEELLHSWDIMAGPGQTLESPSLDIKDTEKGYEMTMELPEFDKKDVKVRVSDNMLTITAEKKQKREDKKKGSYVKENQEEVLSRSLRLPGDADIKGIKAKLKKGKLRVIVPRTGTVKAKHKKVKLS